MASRTKMLSLYRKIIRHARVYPSLSRDSVVQEIRIQFRRNASETDPAKIDQQTQVALKGLQQLMQYTTLNKDSLEWTVNLDQNPLGGPTQERPR